MRKARHPAGDHFEKLEALLGIEREAEKKDNLRELHRYPLATREALGKTVTGLNLESIAAGVAGMSLLTFSRPEKGEELAPFHAMGAGDNVLVTFPAAAHLEPCDGTLYKADEYRVTVAVSAAPPGRPVSGCQVDLIGSDATYKQMKKALAAVGQAGRNRLAELRELFMGQAKPRRSKPADLRFFNQALNEYQREAVARSLTAKEAALVHGPPGTGKTTVLVEIIRQAAAQGERVLASAPSNIAVDNILEKLLSSGLRVVRLGHPARTLESLREGNLAFLVENDPGYEEVRELDAWRERLSRKKSRFGRGQLGYEEQQDRDRQAMKLWRQARDIEFDISRRLVGGAQVVLATHAGISTRFVKGNFDLVVMDEASQAMEPLSWIPLTMAQRVIFAGDSNQLPPTIHSKDAASRGLALTLFERLKGFWPQSLQSRLRVQYRMHESIMGFSSREFYDDQLIADESVRRHTVAGLPGVQSTELTSVPLVFVDTAGAGFDENFNEMLESRENRGEAELVVRLLDKLLGAGLAPRQAALLTPYVAQARLLKSLAKRPGLEIGSVDAFQGREKEAVIVSLVRSNLQGEIGFLSDTRRMNVALTRARRLLIVIGDSATLARHPFYARFLDYAVGRKAHRSSYEWPS